ncbi:MAG: flagellar filament capping protein FliD [Candidatus Hydrogenedentes bacterium]|nr:flagellar filament capping protein FliD [Candidatus Hydrogenedentota bacterium]
MSGTISTGGLISGIDTETMIEMLMQIERQPIDRYEEKISELEQEKEGISALLTQLSTLLGTIQEFESLFDSFGTTSSDESVLTADIIGETPTSGTYRIDVEQLATATVAGSSSKLGAAIDPDAALSESGILTDVTAGTFTINGVEFTIDPDTDSLNDILAEINSSDAGVTATYDSSTDTVVFANSTAGDTSRINFGEADDDGESNFLDAIAVTDAMQAGTGDNTTRVESTRNLGSVNASDLLSVVDFADGGVGAVTGGSFSVNGVSITVDPTTDTLADVIARINDSDAGVTASYDTSSDTIRIVADDSGSRTIRFGSASDTSNFLEVVNLDDAVQTAGKDAMFTINEGETLTRSTNEISDAIGGVTIELLSTGESTLTVSSDDDAIVEAIQEFLDEFNASMSAIRDMTGEDGVTQNDGSIRMIQTMLTTTIFSAVNGLSGDFTSLLDVGISTGSSFDPEVMAEYELDEEALREALQENRGNVEALFWNEDGTGIAQIIEDYLEETTSYTGFLSQRSRDNGTIDQRIEDYNEQIERLEERVSMKEERLRTQYANMEITLASLESQNSALSSLTSYL